jgi:hypothetical protein
MNLIPIKPGGNNPAHFHQYYLLYIWIFLFKD